MGAMAWQITLVVVVVALLDRLLRRASPSWRHALWGLVFVKLLLPPDLAAPWAPRVAVSGAGAVGGQGAEGFSASALLMMAWALLVGVLFVVRVRRGRT